MAQFSLFFWEAFMKLSILLFNLTGLAYTLKSFLLLLTKWTMTVISIHPILTGPAIKTRVTLTVIDDGITRFAWVHRTTQIEMDEVADNTGKPGGEHNSLSPQARPHKSCGPFITSQLRNALQKKKKSGLQQIISIGRD